MQNYISDTLTPTCECVDAFVFVICYFLPLYVSVLTHSDLIFVLLTPMRECVDTF